MNQNDFCKEMLTVLSGVVCTPAEGYEKAGMGWIISDVKELIKKNEELEKQNAVLKKFWKQLYEAIEQEEQKDGYCRLVISKEQLLNGKEDFDHFLGDNDILKQVEDLEAQAAAYREALKYVNDNITVHCHDGFGFAPDYKTTYEAKKKIEQALSSTAGRDLLERMKQLEKAFELACDSQIACPGADRPWNCDERGCNIVQCWKEYFLHKAGVSTP